VVCQPRLFCFFLAFFEKNLTNASLLERFQKMDPDLGAMDSVSNSRPACANVAYDVAWGSAPWIRAPTLGALICGADPRRPDPRRRGAFIARPLPNRTFLGFSLPPFLPSYVSTFRFLRFDHKNFDLIRRL
jgi:hypothetical protein